MYVAVINFPDTQKDYAFQTKELLEIGEKYKIWDSNNYNYNDNIVTVKKAWPGTYDKARVMLSKVEKVGQTKEIHNIKPEKVIFNDPATIVYWTDGTKTVVKCQDTDCFEEDKGLMLAHMKKFYGNSGYFNEVMQKWVWEPQKKAGEIFLICFLVYGAITFLQLIITIN